MHICLHVHVHVHVCVYEHTHTQTRTHINTHTRTHTRTHTHTYTYTHVHTHTHTVSASSRESCIAEEKVCASALSEPAILPKSLPIPIINESRYWCIHSIHQKFEVVQFFKKRRSAHFSILLVLRIDNWVVQIISLHCFQNQTHCLFYSSFSGPCSTRRMLSRNVKL